MTVTEPQLGVGKRVRWDAWLVLWVGLVLVQSVLLLNDARLDSLAWRVTRWFTGDQDAYKWVEYKAAHAAELNAPFYDRIDPPMRGRFYTRTEKVWRLFRDLGEPYLTVVLIVAVSIYDRRRVKAGVMLLAGTCAAGLFGALIRMTGGRFRPIETDGVNHWEFLRGFHDGRDLAWPSGHATLAFATAAVLTYLSPRGRWLFVVMAGGCAVARVVMQAHFWSDAVFGGVLGWTVGWWVAVALDRVIAPAEARTTA
ncbi:MAG TPA: phosphatase PAP2 family protein [Phycisphaerae bacterium]|nr:phosphatase PAP2 family protein [Phycisphaerae bacterium]